MTIEQMAAVVVRAMEDGTSFSLVEDVINDWPVTELAKSALWLLAWSCQPAEVQRAWAHAHVTAFGGEYPESSPVS